jgi:hypothetical protein
MVIILLGNDNRFTFVGFSNDGFVSHKLDSDIDTLFLYSYVSFCETGYLDGNNPILVSPPIFKMAAGE